MAGLAAFVRFVDRLNDALGRGVAWLTLAMVLITFAIAGLFAMVPVALAALGRFRLDEAG